MGGTATPIMAQPPASPGLQLDPASILAGQPVINQPPAAATPQTAITPVQQDVTVTAPQVTPIATAYPDMVAAAVHHSRLADIANVVGNMLAGPTTPHLVQNPDGTMIVQQQPSTTGEKWSRIAAAAILGAGKGFAAGGGPLGAGRALGAGLETGAGIQPGQKEFVQGEATQANQDLLNRANVAAINQKLAIGQLSLTQAGMQVDKEFADSQQDIQNFLGSHGGNIQHTHVSNEPEVRAWLTNHMDAATSADFKVVPTYDDQHRATGFDIYQADKAWGDQKAPGHKQDNWTLQFDSKGNPTITNNPVDVPANQQTNQQMLTASGAAATQYMALKDQMARYQASTAGAAHTEAETTSLLPAQVATQRAQAAYLRAQATKDYASVGLGPDGKTPQGSTDAAGNKLHGEQYLATIAPELQDQIRQMSRGETAAPPASSRAPNAMMMRNLLFQYDPTYTDSRYTAVQNFKTKGDATSLVQLGTAMEHAERALSNSDAIGYGVPSMSPFGQNPQYRQDVDYFTGEGTRLIEGKAGTQKELEEKRNALLSPIPSVRQKAIQEQLDLIGAKVKQINQKFQNATGMPVWNYLDAPTLQRLRNVDVGPGGTPPTVPGPPSSTPPPTATTGTPAPATGGGAAPAPTFQAAPRQPPNPPYPGAVFGVGPNGPGWYSSGQR